MKKILKPFLILLFSCFASHAQDAITTNFSQDARLLFVGDDKGNEPGTLNISTRIELQGNQRKSGYFIVAPEFEFARLNLTEYYRYSMNVGYTFTPKERFNSNFFSNFKSTITFGIGGISHNNSLYFTNYSSNLQLSYKVSDKVEFFIDTEIVERTDFIQYGPKYDSFFNRIRISGKFGIKIKILDTNFRK